MIESVQALIKTMTMKSVSSVTLLAVLCSYFFAIASAAPVPAPAYQILIPRPGFIPVYIRYGDTPLADIDPGLAAAFNEIDVSNSMLEDAPEMTLTSSKDKVHNDDDDGDNDDADKTSVDQMMSEVGQEATGFVDIAGKGKSLDVPVVTADYNNFKNKTESEKLF